MSKLFLILLFIQCYGDENYTILRKIPRTSHHFTQGLFFDTPSTIIESSGLYGNSRIQRLNATTGEIITYKDLNTSYFGEGCTMINNKIYQLTWRERKCFVYDLDLNLIETKELMKEIREGWGITSDDSYLYVSDGSSKIYIIDPNLWTVVRILVVRQKDQREIRKINELEYVNGSIYSNVFTANDILVINAETGIIDKKYNMEVLLRTDESAQYQKNMYRMPYEDVLNGIAYNNGTGTFYITGKRWNYIFEIVFE